MNKPLPYFDDYEPKPDREADLADIVRMMRGTLDYILDPKTPVWLTGDDPGVVGVAITSMHHVRMCLGHHLSNFEQMKNAASCQNAAPRLSETTEPQAL